MPLWFEAIKALTVEVRAPLPTYRDRAPQSSKFGTPGEWETIWSNRWAYRLGRDPESLTWGNTTFLGSAGASVSRIEHLVATFEAMARFGARHPQGHHA